MTGSTRSVCAVVHRRFEGACARADPAVSFAAEPGGFALESVCDTAGYGRFSIYGSRPVRWLESAAGDAPGVRASLIELGRPIRMVRPDDAAHLPFVGGWVGCIPYEAGAALENVVSSAPGPRAFQRLRFGLYDAVAVHDGAADTWHLCAADLPESTLPAAERIEWLATRLLHARGAASDLADGAQSIGDLPVAEVSRDAYIRAAERALRYIAAGDIYQVNLTQRFSAQVTADPLAIYLRLRRANPADFAAYLAWDQSAVISASPELFLQVGPDRSVVTRPIKGTRPRGLSPADDAAARAELAASPKDRAELNMIIDLLRNDLGRVCEIGSVRVLAEADIETHPTVVHLVGTMAGRLRDDVNCGELLAATLPGGSITGCPKIRAMQIIRELEPAPRGAYCGAIGYVGLDGRCAFNVAIRTMQHEPRGDGVGVLHLHAGGAITADSDPEAEYAETLAKAEGMFRALGHTTAALDAAPAVR